MDQCLRCLLLFTGMVLVVVGSHNMLHGSDWAMGDWLINYSGGFVRRGLVGSLALLAAKLGIPLVVSVFALQITLYVAVLFGVWRLLRDVQWTLPLAALVFSPATLQFVVMDPSFAFRKELLFFALLTGLMVVLGTMVISLPVLSVALSAGCAICVLSHEALTIFFPYLFCGLCLGMRSLKRAMLCFSPPAMVSLLLFAVVSGHPGNEAISQAVCSSIGGTLTDPPAGVCGGAIAYLGRSKEFAREHVSRVASSEHYARHMPLLMVLTLVPIVLQLVAMWRRRERFAVCTIVTLALVSSLASVTLFLYGTDWTRWIYIHAFSLMVLLGFCAMRRRESAEPPLLPFRSPWARMASLGLLLVYVFGWHLALYQPKVPFGGLIHYALSIRRNAA